MIDYSLFHFLRPWWLLLLIPACALILWRNKLGRSSPWQNVVDEHLQPFVLVGPQRKNIGFFGSWSLPLFVFFVTLALAGPTLKKIPSESELLRKPLIIAFELSDHMLSSDISPSRLKRAIYKIKDLLQYERGREVSLIAFAGDAHVVVPLTEDHKTLINLLESLSPELMPVSGSELMAALREAQAMIRPGIKADVLVITSTNVRDQPSDLEQFATKHGLDLLLWTFATSAGAPLIKKGGQFAREAGDVKLSQLNSSWLSEMQNKSKVFSFSPDDQDIHALDAYMVHHDAIRKGETKESYDTWYDLGPYFLAFAMLLFLGAVFMGKGGGIFIALLLLMPAYDAKAGFFDRLFMRDDQRAHRALFNNEPEKAAELYTDDFSKGTAYYKAKNYEEALKHLDRVKTEDGYYNLGNTLAQLGQTDKAIEAYNEALKFNKENADARFNKELLEKLKKDQEQQKPKDQSEQSEKPEEKKEEQKDNKDQEGQESGKDDKSKKDEQAQEQKPEDQKKDEEASKKEEQKESSKSEEPKEEPKAEEPKGDEKKAMNKKEQDAPLPLEDKPKDQKTEHQLDHLKGHSNQFLKRKFLYETRTKHKVEQ